MSPVRFMVNMKLNLFCHFMICTDLHPYLKNRYYKQENYTLFSEESYNFFRKELPVYCLELLLKVVSDYPQIDMECLKESLNSHLLKLLNVEAKEYLAYWRERKSDLMALKQLLDSEWPPIEEKLQLAIEEITKEKSVLDDLRIFLVDAFYARKGGEGVTSIAELNMIDKNLLLICACEPEHYRFIFRIIVHEIIHRHLDRIFEQLRYELKLDTDEKTIVNETFARLIEKEVCSRIDIPAMTEEEIQRNIERFGFLDFYLQTASAWQSYIKNATRLPLETFIKSQIKQSREILRKCKYSSSFL